jgi:hypothetical protein
MVEATHTFPQTSAESNAGPEDRVREERKRYTTQLQRRAQAHVTAELGTISVEEDTDRQVTMLVQHALESTGARRVTLLRPVPRGRRWHVATVLNDGCFYYGLVAPETLVLPLAACERKTPVMLGGDVPFDPALPRPSELGLKTYLGVPIVVSGRSIAVVEAIDIAQPDDLEHYAATLEKSVSALADRLATENDNDAWKSSDNLTLGLSDQSILDLVLRPDGDVDDTIEITPTEWSILHLLDGERPLGAVAQSAGMPMTQTSTLVESLLDRGLVRIGRENRRRV